MSETKAIKPVDDVRFMLEKMGPQFKNALPSHIPVEKFVRAVQTAVSNNPNILKADRNSFYAACMKSAEMGLFANGRDASFVCFGSTVTFMPQVAGVMKLIRNSGELATIMAELVHKNDEFSFFVDSSGPHLMHKPDIFGARGEIVGVYALAKMKDDSVYVEILNMDQINSVKKTSRSANNGPWITFFGEMAKKVAIRRLAKRLPMSTDIDQVIAADDSEYDITPQPAAEPEPKVLPKKTSSRLSKLVEAEIVSEPAPQTMESAEII